MNTLLQCIPQFRLQSRQRKYTNKGEIADHCECRKSKEEGDSCCLVPYIACDGDTTDQEIDEPTMPQPCATAAKFKTELCKNWMRDGVCKFKDKCTFAHGTQELMRRADLPMNFQTKECKNYSEKCFCPYKDRCQFIHKCAGKVASYDRLLKQNTAKIESMKLQNINYSELYINLGVCSPLKIFCKLRGM